MFVVRASASASVIIEKRNLNFLHANVDDKPYTSHYTKCIQCVAVMRERERRWAPRVANYLANGKNARSTLMKWGGQLPTAHQFDGCEAWIRGMCRLLTHLSIHSLSPCNIHEHARNEWDEWRAFLQRNEKKRRKNSIQFDCDTLINFVPNQLLSGHCSNDNDDISQASKQLTIACHRKCQR